MPRLTIEIKIELNSADNYGLGLEFQTGQGPMQFAIKPDPKKPFSLAELVEGLANLINIDALNTVSKIDSDEPWSKIFNLEIEPSLTITPNKSQGTAVNAVFQLFDRNGNYGITFGGRINELITIEPEITVYDLIIGYDKSKGGLDIKAKVKFAKQKQEEDQQPELEQQQSTEDKSGDKTEIVTYPFPLPPSGKGQKFQVKYLGLGQRFGPEVDPNNPDIKPIFQQLEQSFTSNDPKTLLTQLAHYYQPDRKWFIGADILLFGWEIRFIFNDPVLYAIDVTAGEGEFKGLELEILYEKLGPHLGVYYGELTIPQKFRTIHLGAVDLTLPSIAIWIYTNGDFKVSIGWPLGKNSICIVVEIFGGRCGFYFAKLRSGDRPASDRTPGQVNYNPILEFGLAVDLGVLKSIDQGVISASMSLTLRAIFQGLLAWEAPDDRGSSITKTPDYYWFSASIGIVGMLQGSVDLKIIKATLSLTLAVSVSAAFEAPYKQTSGELVHVRTEITASAYVKIDLGIHVLFFTIHISFHATISHTFTIGSGDKLASADGPNNPALKGLDSFPAQQSQPQSAMEALDEPAPAPAPAPAPQLESFRAQQPQQPSAMEAFDEPAPQQFESFAMMAEPAPAPQSDRLWGKVPLNLSFILYPTAVYEDSNSSGQSQAVASLAITCPTPKDLSPGTDFQKLGQKFAQWLLNTYSEGQSWNQESWSQVVTALGHGWSEEPQNFKPALIDFLGNTFDFIITGVDLTGEQQPVTNIAVFPMFNELKLVYPGVPNHGVVFADVNHVSENYGQVVSDYFAQLSLSDLGKGAGSQDETEAEQTLHDMSSMTDLLFVEYFLMLARDLSNQLSKSKDSDVTPDLAAQLAGMASRFMLHGLRLPTLPLPQNPQPSALTLNAIYKLTEQQFPILGQEEICEATLSINPGLQGLEAAIHFADSQGTSATAKIPVTPAPSVPSPQWISTETPTPNAGKEQIQVSQMKALTPHPIWFAARNRIPWTDPNGDKYIVPLSSGLVGVLKQQQPLKLVVTTSTPFEDGSYDGNSTINAVSALLIRTKIHRVEQHRVNHVDTDGKATPQYLSNVYQIDGTDDDTRELIYQAMEEKSIDWANVEIQLLYNNPDSNGLQSQQINTSQHPLILVKTNLSTNTQPTANTLPYLMAVKRSLSDYQELLGPKSATTEQPKDFLNLLWECSVVHAGGFYLHYADKDGKGLPDKIFQGDVTDFVVLVKLSKTPQKPLPVKGFHNTILVDKDQVQNSLYIGVNNQTDQAIVQYHETYPAGCIGFEIQWTNEYHAPDNNQGDTHPYSPETIEHLYHMIEYRIQGNDGQTQPKFAPSLWSAALGPKKHSDETSQEQIYQHVVPVYGFVNGHSEPATTNSLYAAIGGSPSLEFRLSDIFGNVLPQTHSQTFGVQYHDPLISPEEWPGVHTAYRFLPGEGDKTSATLQINVSFHPELIIRPKQEQSNTNQQVQTALFRYRKIVDQIGDSKTQLQLSTTLVQSNNGVVGDGDNIKEILHEFAQQIITQLQQYLQSQTSPTPLSQNITAHIPKDEVKNRKDDIFPVQVKIELSRDEEYVYHDALTQLPEVAQIIFVVPADLEPKDGQDSGDQQVALKQFAQDFENSFQRFNGDGSQLKLAVRPSAIDSGSAKHPFIWAMRWGQTAGINVSFKVGSTTYFTLAPLSTELANGKFEVSSYDSKLVKITKTQTFSHIDLDSWARTYLSTVDTIFAPELAVSIAKLAPEYYEQLLECKEKLAGAVSQNVVEVYKQQAASGTGDISKAKERFEEALLGSLANAYTTSAIVQIPAEIDIQGQVEDDTDSLIPPRFFGSVAPDKEPKQKEYTITTSKLAIEKTDKDNSQCLTFLVSVAHPDLEAELSLPLKYHAGFLEHHFLESEEEYGYLPSSWLRFALANLGSVLDLDLGTVDVPIPLRKFPQTPALVKQTANQDSSITSSNGNKSIREKIEDALRWEYSITVRKQEKEAQDDLWIEVTYNLPVKDLSQESTDVATDDRQTTGKISDLFQALASFRDAYQVLQPHLAKLPNAAFGNAYPTSDGEPTSDQIIRALTDKVQTVADKWFDLSGDGETLAAVNQPTTSTSELDSKIEEITHKYVLRFAQAYNPHNPILTLYAQQPEDGSSIDWPTINGQSAQSPQVVDANNAPGEGSWSQANYNITNDSTGQGIFTFIWSHLDVLHKQTAKATFWVVRNADIGEDIHKQVNSELVYQTPKASFHNPALPLIKVARIGPLPSGISLQDTMRQVFTPLVDAGEAATKQRLFKVGCNYAYELIASSSQVSLMSPSGVLLVDDLQLQSDSHEENGAIPLTDFLHNLSADLTTWYDNFGPSTTNAILSTSITLFAMIAGSRLPLVQLENVEIQVPPKWWLS